MKSIRTTVQMFQHSVPGMQYLVFVLPAMSSYPCQEARFLVKLISQTRPSLCQTGPAVSLQTFVPQFSELFLFSCEYCVIRVLKLNAFVENWVF